MRAVLREAYRIFLAAHRRAAENLRCLARDDLFPDGSFLPRLPIKPPAAATEWVSGALRSITKQLRGEAARRLPDDDISHFNPPRLRLKSRLLPKSGTQDSEEERPFIHSPGAIATEFAEIGRHHFSDRTFPAMPSGCREDLGRRWRKRRTILIAGMGLGR